MGIGILNKDNFTDLNKNVKTGLLFIALAALTESTISIFYKKDNLKNPFMSLYTLYAPAFLLLLLVYRGITRETISTAFNSSSLIKIILFNLAIGGIGYTLHLFALTKISISWFSALAFTSSISAFILGWLFLGEQIKIHHLIGTGIIFYNLYFMNKN